MQRYKCHKEVEAMKIEQIVPVSGSGLRWTLVGSGESIDVMAEWMAQHKAEVGGYFVRYKDGYESYSPAKAFEEGYTAI